MSWLKIVRVTAGLAILFLVLPSLPAAAQNPQIVACPAPGQPLLEMPVIHSTGNSTTPGKLQATLKLSNTERILWGDPGDDRCAKVQLRYLSGWQGFGEAPPGSWPIGTDPLPGPTFRARVGDLVNIAFFNQIDIKRFGSTLDRNAAGTSAGCDQTTISSSPTTSATTPSGFRADTMPNCLHGSSTTNVHFHGTHTTPSTTGDNIFLFIRPAERHDGPPRPSEAESQPIFEKIFETCAQDGPPQQWTDLPKEWQNIQQAALELYDSTAPYQGKPGPLPKDMQLWPANKDALDHHQWPQYNIGAYPFCFPLPKYEPGGKYRMGQAPGTMWYHAHKHGSTALNVANGLTGAFIIEGQYDDDLHKYYPNLREQVLVIGQLSAAPFARTNPAAQPKPGAPRPPLAVNGRRNPVVSMQPGEVQQWRIV
ncbi:MAG TPA: hypothetical protein VFS60_00055, partial [Thermoanaerobaculia bacterium]|nr:hypothetical protein [Thermoanaerobaculia bacterium]